jgi:hypothetical protein
VGASPMARHVLVTLRVVTLNAAVACVRCELAKEMWVRYWVDADRTNTPSYAATGRAKDLRGLPGCRCSGRGVLRTME